MSTVGCEASDDLSGNNITEVSRKNGRETSGRSDNGEASGGGHSDEARKRRCCGRGESKSGEFILGLRRSSNKTIFGNSEETGYEKDEEEDEASHDGKTKAVTPAS